MARKETAAKSLVEGLASLPTRDREKFIDGLSDEEVIQLKYHWEFWARPNQLPPDDDWVGWVLCTGRGFGKTRSGGMWVHRRAMEGDERRRIALVSKTPGDARDDMIEGLGGILRNVPPDEVPEYNPSKRRLTWPTGAWATVYSGAHPDQARGFSGDTVWADELAAWKYPQETWDNLLFGMREAQVSSPRFCVTTTPRPIPLIKDLIQRCATSEQWYLVTGSSYENRANLHPIYYAEVIAPYEGTTLGQQEIYGKLLSDVPEALWRRKWIDKKRKAWEDELPDYTHVAVAIDPAAEATDDSSETGIMVGALGRNGQGYLLYDLSGKSTPEKWAQRAVSAYKEERADAIVAEVNNGGDMVRATIHAVDPHVPVLKVHASRGKRTRAEPVATKSELGKIHHVGSFPELEDQLCTWIPGMKSPDRLDAYVWLFTYLFGKSRTSLEGIQPVSISQTNWTRFDME